MSGESALLGSVIKRNCFVYWLLTISRESDVIAELFCLNGTNRSEFCMNRDLKCQSWFRFDAITKVDPELPSILKIQEAEKCCCFFLIGGGRFAGVEGRDVVTTFLIS